MGVPWPAAFESHSLFSTTRRTSESGLLRSENDTGPANVRRRFTATADRVAWVIPRLTGAQYEAYLDFVKNDLLGGALPVDMLDPLNDALREARIMDPPGQAQPLIPDPVPANRVWRVSFTLEFLP